MPAARQPPSVRCGSSLCGEEPWAQLKVRFERSLLVFDVCLTPKGFIRVGASEVCSWHWWSPLSLMASTLSMRSTESCQNWAGLRKLRMPRSRDWLQGSISRPSCGWLPAALAGKHCLQAASSSWSPGGSKTNDILEGGKLPLYSQC